MNTPKVYMLAKITGGGRLVPSSFAFTSLTSARLEARARHKSDGQDWQVFEPNDWVLVDSVREVSHEE